MRLVELVRSAAVCAFSLSLVSTELALDRVSGACDQQRGGGQAGHVLLWSN